MPGPRIGDRGMVPMFAIVSGGHPVAGQTPPLYWTGSANAEGSYHLRNFFGTLGSPTISGRAPSPPPVRLMAGDSFIVIVSGLPLSKVVISEICQPSKTARTNRWGARRLIRGRSQTKWNVKIFGRS